MMMDDGHYCNFCSSGGSCLEDLQAGVAEAVEATSPPPPTLTLRTTGALGAYLDVAKGITYDVCAAGVEPTVEQPCELGATAAAGEDSNLTSRVLVCPPASCVTSGVGCSGHTMAQKGLQVRGSSLPSAAELISHWERYDSNRHRVVVWVFPSWTRIRASIAPGVAMYYGPHENMEPKRARERANPHCKMTTSAFLFHV